MSKELDDFNAALEKADELERRKKALAEKDLTLKEHRVGLDLDILVKNSNEIEQAKTISFGQVSQEEIEKLVRENDDYMEAAKHSMRFINKEFKGVVPYFRKNLIVVLADTGQGKSTAVANIAFETITHINPATGKAGRVLVLTNEEAAEDFYNRVTCHIKGWNYTKHDQFNDEQRQAFRDNIPILARNGRLTVIGNTYKGISGWTRTVDGMKTILENLTRDEDWYDVIIIDYYQNVTSSKTDPRLDIYKCQERFADMLDEFKTSYPAPIVVMAQINKLKDEEDTTPYNIRIKGRKTLCDKATFICELIPEHKLLRSKWTIHKSRFTGTVGQSVYTGFDRGKFIPYSLEFQANVSKIVDRNLEREKEQELGFPSQGDEDDKKDS